MNQQIKVFEAKFYIPCRQLTWSVSAQPSDCSRPPLTYRWERHRSRPNQEHPASQSNPSPSDTLQTSTTWVRERMMSREKIEIDEKNWWMLLLSQSGLFYSQCSVCRHFSQDARKPVMVQWSGTRDVVRWVYLMFFFPKSLKLNTSNSSAHTICPQHWELVCCGSGPPPPPHFPSLSPPPTLLLFAPTTVIGELSGHGQNHLTWPDINMHATEKKKGLKILALEINRCENWRFTVESARREG